MSCGQIALIENGTSFDTYYASEIDKHAIKQTQLNFPKTERLGDMERWREWDIDWSSIDLIMAGTPCQGFSLAGKGKAFEDPRSKLFWRFVEILEHARKYNPNVQYLLENVRMSLVNMSVITNALRIYPVLIDGGKVSAQHRERFYWTNFKTRYNETFKMDEVSIPQPLDCGLVLRDILEPEVDEKYYLSDRIVETLIGIAGNGTSLRNYFLDPDSASKSNTITARYHKSGTSDPYIAERRIAGVDITPNGLRPYKNDGRKGSLPELGTVATENGKAGTVTVAHPPKIIQVGNLEPKILTENYRIRRLTPTECARLQCIPSWYKWACSDTQQYKMLGNGWNIAVIQHLLKFCEA